MADAARQIPHVVSDDTPALIVFFKDGAEPARGSWYPAELVEDALAGAREMELQALEVKGSELQELAGKVPKGRLFSSGKLFLPRIKDEIFDRLITLHKTQSPTPHLSLVKDAKAATQSEKSETVSPNGSEVDEASLPDDWSKIGVGSMVLTRDIEEEDDAW
ncbi:hypothetical protein [Pseudovibrio sp. SCP19]|uniref:hypothetical protein n=1 Tax=Pseudovibrio sp. SCP19 TaxID=3141374 RepID=UPI00333AEA82